MLFITDKTVLYIYYFIVNYVAYFAIELLNTYSCINKPFYSWPHTHVFTLIRACPLQNS